MATAQFVKWWKTKFQTRHHSACVGYNTMSVLSSDGSDGRPSDTEDLLRDDASSCHNGAHVNAGLASTGSSDNSSICSSDHHNHQQFISNQVKFEDFECDVQVEGSESGEERKEFSFTFYDLDGHGKITKDDIAGLVRSIYGAVNDSITVPQGGKKTIKVRLTVTPEQQKESEELKNNVANNNNLPPTGESPNPTVPMGCGISTNEDSGPTEETTTTTRLKVRNNVNVTIRENLNRHGSARHHRDRYSQQYPEKRRFNSVRIPNTSHGHQQNLLSDCRGCRNLLPEVIRDCGASPMRHRKEWRERKCTSFQRPDLCELIQANMEKNNVYPCCRNDTLQQIPPMQAKGQPHPPSPLCSHNHLIDPNCPILPLLNNDNLVCKEKLVDASHHCSSSRSVKFSEISPGAKFLNSHKTHIACRKHGHHRSRSHDLSQNHPVGDNRESKGNPSTPSCNNHHYHCRSHEESLEILTTGCVLNPAQPLPPQPSPRNKNTNNNKNILNKLTPGTTPHQLKHRNREEDHARAMTQVINWLQRENIGDKNSSTNPKPCFNFQQHHLRPFPGSPPIGKKQEHHHVHEHFHHHYHHHFGKETPIIV